MKIIFLIRRKIARIRITFYKAFHKGSAEGYTKTVRSVREKMALMWYCFDVCDYKIGPNFSDFIDPFGYIIKESVNGTFDVYKDDIERWLNN